VFLSSLLESSFITHLFRIIRKCRFLSEGLLKTCAVLFHLCKISWFDLSGEINEQKEKFRLCCLIHSHLQQNHLCVLEIHQEAQNFFKMFHNQQLNITHVDLFSTSISPGCHCTLLYFLEGNFACLVCCSDRKYYAWLWKPVAHLLNPLDEHVESYSLLYFLLLI